MSDFFHSKTIENSIQIDKVNRKWKVLGSDDVYSYNSVSDCVATVEDVKSDDCVNDYKYNIKVKVLLKDRRCVYINLSDKPIQKGTVEFHDERRTQERLIALFKTIIINS